MSTDKMTGYPWKAGDATKSSTGIFIKDADGRPILRVYSYQGESPDNIERVTIAINNTYGAGINPEAVPELLQAVKELKQAFIRANKFYSKDHEILGLANAAIEKARL